MKVGIIGSGGREHAICRSIQKSKNVKKIYCFPGNAGTSEIADNIEIDLTDFSKIKEFSINNQINLLIVGPEKPLVDGIVDFFQDTGIDIFGPDKISSQLEGSKIFTKKICDKYNIPTAGFGIFKNPKETITFLDKTKFPLVVKADGLASGKGVSICKSKNEALKITKEILNGKFKSSNKVVLEEFLKGEELSYFVVVDKNSFRFFGSAQDHKQVGEGDKGPNTGGMGAYSPAYLLTNKLEKKIKEKIIVPTINAMKILNHPYKGFLYAGLMINKGEPYLIEYNIRMGDPECQALMMRLETDLFDVINAVIKNKIKNLKIKWSNKNSITIVLCAKGYPSNYVKNSEIKGLLNIFNNTNNQIFHAGTYIRNNKIFSNGGRVLNITSLSKTLIGARKKVLQIINKINWTDGFFRKDIGWKAIKKQL